MHKALVYEVGIITTTQLSIKAEQCVYVLYPLCPCLLHVFCRGSADCSVTIWKGFQCYSEEF